jgi:hypothetical protein
MSFQLFNTNRDSLLKQAVIAGIVAGSVATVAQLLLWWLSAVPLPETLYRDTRLTAAIVMPHSVIAAEVLYDWPSLLMWLVAGSIHFALSLLYAAIFIVAVRRFRQAGSSLWLATAGIAFGLAIYFVNMYGFTWVFPWFVLVRDWITVVTHVVFGLSLALAVRANTAPNAPLLRI